jgi:predicted GIY-YIG superfamily endonuclease
MSWVVYMLKCHDGSIYTGVTNDLEKRLLAHNEGVGAKYTKCRRPVLVMYQEEALNRGLAQKREAAIKKLKRAEKLELILRAKLTNYDK